MHNIVSFFLYAVTMFIFQMKKMKIGLTMSFVLKMLKI